MKKKNERAVTAIDVILAVIAIAIFSTLIFSMLYSNVIEIVKLKKETMAMIYMTEIFENIGIASYSEVIESNTNVLPEDLVESGDYEVDIRISQVGSKDILKKIQLTLTYEVAGKTYEHSMERMKIKE